MTTPTDEQLPQTSTQYISSRQPRVSLIARDWSAIRRALLELIKVRFPNEWKDFGISGNGMAILEVVAYSHAQIGYYIDAAANELFIPTAQTPTGMRRLTAALNYRMQNATAAGVALTAFPSPPNPSKIRLDEGTILYAKNGTVWTLADTTLIPENSAIYPEIGAPTNSPIIAVEGEPKEATFRSTGEAWQRFILPEELVVESSVHVYVDGAEWHEADSLVFSDGYGFEVDRMTSDGTRDQEYELTSLWPRNDNFLVTVGTDPSTAQEWEQVDDLTGAGSTDQVYVLSVDPVTGIAKVLFGDGVNGAVPPSNETVVFTYNVIGAQQRYQLVIEPDGLSSIRFGDGIGAVVPPNNAEVVIEYRVGGGLIGNVEIGGIDTDITGIVSASGDAATVRVQNVESAAGAEPAESVDHAREYAPKYAGSTGRACTVSDYDGLINSFIHPDYGKAAFAKANLHSSFPESNQVDIVLWSRDTDGKLTAAPAAFRAVTKVYIESRADICHYIRTEGGDVVYLDLYITVAIPANLEVSRILNEIRAALVKFFDSTQVLPGRDVHRSQVTSVIQAIEGVSYVMIDAIRLSRRSDSLYALGNGTKVRFRTRTFNGYDADLGAPIIPGTFELAVGDSAATDNGSGSIIGDVDDDGVNEIVYDDVLHEREEPDTGIAYSGGCGPRFYTSYFMYKTYEIPSGKINRNTGDVGTVGDKVLLVDSAFATIDGTLVVTDGIQYAYDDGAGAFQGDVALVGAISDDGSGVAEIYFQFAGAITGDKVVAYYVLKVPGEGSGSPWSDQKLVDPLTRPVRGTTAIVRMAEKVAVDDGNGNWTWNVMPKADPGGGAGYDDRDEANTILYEDEEVIGEDISVWKNPLDSKEYRGRLRETPIIDGLSPLIRPGNIVFSDGEKEIRDEDNGDGSGVLVGDLVDEDNGLNVVYYEDYTVSDQTYAESGDATYSIKFPLNLVIPDYSHGVAPSSGYYFQLKTQVFDGSVFKRLRLQDTTGNGQFNSVDEWDGSMWVAVLLATYVDSHLINYDEGVLDIVFKFDTTNPLKLSFIVRGGTFDLLLTTPFTLSPTVSYRKANGGHFDLVLADADSDQILFEVWDQALGGNFDLTLADTPSQNDLILADYRYRYQLDLEDQRLLSVIASGVTRVSGRLDSFPVKRGSFVVYATDVNDTDYEVRDDGNGNIVGSGLASSGKNYIDYATGVYAVEFTTQLQVGNEVLANFSSYLEPEKFVPILNDQIAALATIDLTQTDPRDF